MTLLRLGPMPLLLLLGALVLPGSASRAQADTSGLDSLLAHAEALRRRGGCAEARPVAEQAVALLDGATNGSVVDLARALTILGMVQLDCQDAAAARASHLRALELRRSVLGSDHPDLASGLVSLAAAHKALGEYDEALGALERARQLRVGIRPDDDPLVSSIVQGLSDIRVLQGRLAEGQALALEALAAREKKFGSSSAVTADSYNNLGFLFYRRGQWDGAVEMYRKAAAAYEADLGAGHPNVAMALENLGGMFIVMGDDASAVSVLDRCLDIRRAAQGDDSPALVFARVNLAISLVRLGDVGRASREAEAAAAGARSAWGESNPGTIAVLEAANYVEEKTGRLPEALRTAEIVLAARQRLNGAEHPDRLRCADRVAELLGRSGRSVEAARLFAETDSIRAATGAASEPFFAHALAERAIVEWQLGNDDAALRHARDAERMAREQFRLTARALPERQALLFAAERVSSRDLLVTMAMQPGVRGDVVEAAWEAVAGSRGLVLEEMAARFRAARAPGDSIVAARRDAFVDATADLSLLLTQLAEGGATKEMPAELRAARDRRTRAEEALAEVSRRDAAAFRAEASLLAEAAAHQPSGSMLLAYVRFRPVSRDPGSRDVAPPEYGAFLRSDDVGHRFVELGAAEAIDPTLMAWREALRRPFLVNSVTRGRPESADSATCDSLGAEVRRLVWTPLEPLFAAARLVLVVPEGPLHLVNLNALPEGDGRYLVETDRLVHVLTAERDLLPEPESTVPGGLLLVGDVDYDAPILESGRSEGEVSGHPQTVGTEEVRGAAGSARFRDVRFPPLKETRRELSRIETMWSDAGRRDVERLVGAAATESEFRRRAPGHRWVHLATHGFVIGDGSDGGGGRGVGGLVVTSGSQLGSSTAAPPPGDEVAPPGAGSSRPSVHAREPLNPLRLSGVVLAGANNRAAARRGSSDGILEAEELASLDLTGTEWAVVSACRTGSGEVVPGEGLFGFRRALRMAGVRTVILSLWDVDDSDAADFIEALYGARIRRGLSTPEALREATRALILTRRMRGGDSHPAFWAAFVAAGDWN